MDRVAWWAAGHGIAKSQTRLSDFTFNFHFHALEKEMATHSSVLASFFHKFCVRTGVCMFSQSPVMKQFMSNNRLIMLDVNLKSILMFTVNLNVQKTLP